jgi:hypothetical protein
MSTTIPAPVVTELRGALYHQLGGTAEDLASVHYEPPTERLSEWSEPLARVDRARALLDRIGWCAPDPERDVEIDLDRHRRVIVDALGHDLILCRSLASEKGDAAKDRERARAQAVLIEAFAESAGLDLVHEPEQRITVPDDFLPLLTECVLGVMHDAAEELEQAGFDVDSYPEPLEQLGAIRAALDAIGWGATGSVDLGIHRWAFEKALRDRLATERHLQASAERMPTDAGKTQREIAYRHALEIETFMSDAGLAIPPAGESDV